jgi:hypothetical protein
MIQYLLPIFSVFIYYQTLPAEPKLHGKWRIGDSGDIIEFFRQDSTFYGKIVEVADNSNKDKVGHLHFIGMRYLSQIKKFKGRVESIEGLTADCELEFIDASKLMITVKKLFYKKTRLLLRVD